MYGRRFVWYDQPVGRPVMRKCAEIVLAVIIFSILALLVPVRCYAAGSEEGYEAEAYENEISYRVKPMQEKLRAMRDEEIDSILGSYGDMQSHWSRREVGMLSLLGIINGYNGRFYPDDPVQVDQFLKMTVRSMGFAPGENTKYWAQNYIDIALQQKLIAKSEFDDYRRPITREEATRIIVKATLLKEEFPYNDPYNNPDNLVRSKIKDYAKIKDENKQYVLMSYEIGLIRGSGGLFRPADTLTRAEAATIMIRYLNDSSRVPFTPAEDEVYTCVNPDGKIVTAWPPPKKEIIDAANAFRNVGEKSKGFVVSGFSESGHVIFYDFFESEQKYRENSLVNTQMWIYFNIIDDPSIMDNPYHIVLYDATAVQRLHRDVVYEMFKFWFENEADKAMAEFDRYLGYAVGNDQEHRAEEITYNGREMFFHKIGGVDGFTISISSPK